MYLRRGRGWGCADAAGRGSANESEPGSGWFGKSGTHSGAGQQGGGAGGSAARSSARRCRASGAVVGAGTPRAPDRAGPAPAHTRREPEPPARGESGCAPRAPCGARAPPGSNPRADASTSCARAGAAEVSERRAPALPWALPAAPEAPAAPPLPRSLPRARDPPSSPPSRFSREVQLSAWGARRPGGAGSPGGDPGSGAPGTPGPSAGRQEKQRSPQAGSWRLPRPPPPPGALPAARRCRGRGRRDLRNPPSQPTPTPCEPKPRIWALPWTPSVTIVSPAIP